MEHIKQTADTYFGVDPGSRKQGVIKLDGLVVGKVPGKTKRVSIMIDAFVMYWPFPFHLMEGRGRVGQWTGEIAIGLMRQN